MAHIEAQSPPTSADEYLAATVAELTEHCAGSPNAAERLLIDRAAALSLRLRRMESAMFAGALSAADDERYETLLNRLCRILGMLGLVGGLNHAKDLRSRISLKGEHRAERNGNGAETASPNTRAEPPRTAPNPPPPRPHLASPSTGSLRSSLDDALIEQWRALQEEQRRRAQR